MVLGDSKTLFLTVSEPRGDVSEKENRKDSEKGLVPGGETDEAGDEESGDGPGKGDGTHTPGSERESER